MNIDLGLLATPAKCRLLCALQQYNTLELNIDDSLKERAKQDLIQFDPANEFEQNENVQQVYQFLSDIERRAVIASKTEIDIMLLYRAAKKLGYDHVIVISRNEKEMAYRFNDFDLKVPIFGRSFFNENYEENIRQYKDHLVLYHMTPPGYTTEVESLLRVVSHHFEKIWVGVEYYIPSFMHEDVPYWEQLKQMLMNVQKTNYSPITKPELFAGQFEIDGEMVYYPKLE